MTPDFELFSHQASERYLQQTVSKTDLTVRLARHYSNNSRELDHAQLPVSVNVGQENITLPSGQVIDFDLDPFQKHCLMNGLNEIDLSLEFNDAITAFEENHRKTFPWTIV